MAARRMALVFDLDGTLVDSVYQHVVAWHHALLANGIELSIWRIHRRIGMSGGLFTRALLRETGREFDPDLLERLRQAHAEAYNKMSGDVRPLPGAVALLPRLTAVGCPWGIATSGRMETAGPVLAKLGVPDSVPIITRDMVAHAKPDPDLFLACIDRLGCRPGQRLRGRRQRLGSSGRAPRRHAGHRRCCRAATAPRSWSAPAPIASTTIRRCC